MNVLSMGMTGDYAVAVQEDQMPADILRKLWYLVQKLLHLIFSEISGSGVIRLLQQRNTLVGVYNMNKGYADFKQINILYRNEDECDRSVDGTESV